MKTFYILYKQGGMRDTFMLAARSEAEALAVFTKHYPNATILDCEEVKAA